MNTALPLTRAEFDHLVADHHKLIDLANDLELHVYRLGELPADDRVAQCQHAAGALLEALRGHLFRYDQTVLPILDSLTTQTRNEQACSSD